MAQSLAQPALSKNRVEALTDGIFAVAMTLLVIELKLPDRAAVVTQRDFVEAVAALIPKFQSWLISFFILAIFWYKHHRQFHYVRIVDAKLLWLNIVYLSFVSLMPFSSAMAGEYPRMLLSQIAYSVNMILLAAGGLVINHYVFHHPQLWSEPITRGFYRGSLFRTAGLIVVALGAIGVAMVIPGAANAAFMLMIPISIISKRVELEPGQRPAGVK
jgi:TMEM175 potassium channel family protein